MVMRFWPKKVDGPFNSSMSAKSFGMLAAARFVLHAANRKKQKINNLGDWTDSESPTKRIRAMNREKLNP